ncbi:hypothetical protein [Stutzerimonas stutzeri]
MAAPVVLMACVHRTVAIGMSGAYCSDSALSTFFLYLFLVEF